MSVTMNAPTTVTKLHDIIREQNAILINRTEQIHGAWLAALSGEHIFYLGRPGVAKSMLATDMTMRIAGAEFFQYLMRKDSKTSEIFGPPSLKALGEDRYEFITDGRLAEAHFAFLDEIFKSSSAILNSLLTALNEREFDNGGRRMSIPLITVFSASNELPQGEELGPLYDRFLLRFHVRGLDDDNDFRNLLAREPKLDPNGTALSLDEFTELRDLVKEVTIPDEVLDKLVELRGQITAAGMWASERRWLKGLKVLRANAVLHGRTEVTEDDIEVFQYILWDTLPEEKKAARLVLGIINPLNVRFLQIMDNAEEAYREVKNEVDRGGNVLSLAMEHQQNLKKAQDEIKELLKSTTSPAMQERLKNGFKTVRSYNKYVTERGLGITVGDL
jgi:MoxR-like ATPase